MKNCVLALLFILSYSSFSSDEQSSDFQRYKDNYCKNGNSKITGALISCDQEILTSKIEQEDNILKVINSFIEVDFKTLCANPSKYSDRIKSYRESDIELKFPPNACVCNLPDLNFGGEIFCSMNETDSKTLDRDYKANVILEKLKGLGLDDQSCISEEMISKCKSPLAKESIDFILNDFEFQEQDIVIKNNLIFLKELNSSNIKNSCEQDSGSNIQEICSLLIKSNSEVVQSESLDSSSLSFSSKHEDNDSLTNLDIYSCLNSKNTINIANTEASPSTNEGPGIERIITLPSPEEIAKLNKEHSIAISETDSVPIINRKINNAVRKKEYEKNLVRTQDIASELNTLTSRLNVESNPLKRKEIFSRISDIKSELRSLSKTVPQKSNFSSISGIEKKFPEESKKYYAEAENTPSTQRQISSNNYQKALESNKVIPLGKKESTTANSHKEYNPVYNKTEPKKAISIAGPIKNDNDISSKKNDKSKSISNFFGGNSSASRSPASVGNTSSSKMSSNTSNTAVSNSFIPVKSYEINTSSKQDSVINNGEFPRLKIVYIDDLKVMKLFKYKSDQYKLEEELSKDDFLESYSQFPPFVQEEGVKFFNVKSVKDLNQKIEEK